MHAVGDRLDAFVRGCLSGAALHDRSPALLLRNHVLEHMGGHGERRTASLYLLERVAAVLARGDAITVVPLGKELTTQQAADLLNVSRQYLVRLLDEGRVPYAKTGKRRRLRIEDVLAFKKRRDEDRKDALDELPRLSQDFGGCEELKK